MLAAVLGFGAYYGVLRAAGLDSNGNSPGNVAASLEDAVSTNGDGTLTGATCAKSSGNVYRCIGSLDSAQYGSGEASFEVTVDGSQIIYQQQ